MVHRKPEQAFVLFNAAGRMVTESSNYESSSFREFVRIIEPSFLEKMSRNPSEIPYYENGNLRSKALNASFCINYRNSKSHFGFGFNKNYEISLNSLLKNIYPRDADQSLSVDEKVTAVLKNHPHIYESTPDEDGSRWFVKPHFNYDKRSWIYNFTNNRIIV